jgi:hypothetical protein
MFVVEPPEKFRGDIGGNHSPGEIAEHFEEEIAFQPITPAPSVYRFETSRMLVVTWNVTRVRRTDLYGLDGNRIYQVDSAAQVAIMGGPVQLEGSISDPSSPS